MDEHINNLLDQIKIKSLAFKLPAAIEFMIIKNKTFLPLTPLLWQRVFNDFNSNNKLIQDKDNFEIKDLIQSQIYGLYFYLLNRRNFTNKDKLQVYRLIRPYGSIDFYPTSFQIIITINDFVKFDYNDITLLLTKVQDTIYIYDYGLRDDIVIKFNTLLNVNSDTISLEAVVQPRNLKLEDLVYGGLIGNKDTPYLVSYKADGFRKFLFIDETGIWLLSPPLNISWIVKPEPKTSGLIQSYKNYIFDGELIPPEKQTPRQNKTLFYVGFDVVTSKSIDYDERFDTLQSFKTFLDDNQLAHLLFMVKSSIKLTTIDLVTWPPTQFFFNLMELMLNKDIVAYQNRYLGVNSQPFKTDGLIFTPSKIPYQPLGRGIKLNERILTRYPDVCKWKPADQLTVDLLYKNNKIYARSLKSIPFDFKFGWQPDISIVTIKEGDIVEFRPNLKTKKLTAINVNTRTTTSKLNEVVNSLRTGGIVYLRYENNKFIVTGGEEDEIINEFVSPPTEGIWEFKVQDKVLIPIQPRPDKTYPNNKETAIELLRLNDDPILPTTLTGADFRLVRRYFHREKRYLFDTIPPGQTLLDLGSGEGGDLTKMRHFKEITLVEPNVNNFEVLQERIKNLKLSQTTAINVRAEDLKLKKKFDVISLMLSLSFFDKEKLEKLCQVIDDHLNDDGQVLIFTIDGEAVQESFRPSFTGFDKTEYKLGPVYLSLIGNKLDINWQGTILANVENPELRGQQTEYLFFLNDMLKNLMKFKIKDIKRAGGELLLNQPQYQFAQLYSSVILTKMSQYKGLIAGKVNQKISLSSKKPESVTVDPYAQIPNNMFKLETSRYNLIYLIRGEDMVDCYLSGFSSIYNKRSPQERQEVRKRIVGYIIETEEDVAIKETFQNNIFPLDDGDETKTASVILSDEFKVQLVIMNLINLEPEIWSTTIDDEHTGPTVVVLNILGQYYLVATEEEGGFKTTFYPKNKSLFENSLFATV
jgi:hypothetical protein